MKHLLPYLLYSILLLLPAGVKAAPHGTQLLHFSIKNGFPSNNVYSVIQDRHGYLWFATDNGVVKYNGYSFKIFNTESGLPANDVWKLFEDSYGRIWLHAYTYEIGYLENDRYYKLPLSESKTVISPLDIMEKNGIVVFSYLRNKVVPTLVLTGRNFTFELPVSPRQIWQITESGLLYLVMPDRERIYRLDIFNPQAPPVFVHRIKDLPYRFASQNRMFNEKLPYYVTYDNGGTTIGLHNMSTDSDRIAYVPEVLQGESDETIYTIGDSHPGYWFITNRRVGTCNYNFTEVKNDTVSFAVARQAQIAFTLKAKNGDNWYTTTSQGVYHHVSVPALFEREETLVLPPDAVVVGCDRYCNLYWQDKLTSNVYITDTSGHMNRLPFEGCGRLLSVMDSYNDSLMYFSFSTGIYEMDRKNNHYLLFLDKFRHVVLQNSEFLNLKQKSDVFTTPSEKNYFRNQRKLLRVGKNDFIGMGLAAVYYFHAQDTDMMVWTINNERYSNLFYDSMYRRCVLYNDNKIAICETPTMSFRYFTADGLGRLGIHDIEQILSDRHGNFFIKTGFELFVYTPAKGLFRQLASGVNLANCRVLLYDDYIFIAGPFGIGYMKNDPGNRAAQLHVSVNVKNLFYHRLNDMVITTPGKILLNTDNGLYTVSIDEILHERDLLRPTVNAPFHLLLSSPYQTNVYNGDTLVIKQGPDKVTLNTINYYGNGPVSYSYQIADLQDEWQQSASGEIIISRLKPGAYVKVACVMKDDVWRSFPLSFYIYRPLLWWQTKVWQTIFWVAGITVFLLILLSVFLLTRYSVARTNEKKRLLTDLELRAIHAQINPHFIFNTLSTALYFIHRKEVEKAYTHVNKFSHLLRAYLKSSRNRYVTLADEISMIRKYIELQQARFEERFDYSIEVENRIPAANVQIPSLLLQPLVENAITHGLFHKELKEQGLLKIRFYQGTGADELICEIEDNGVGRVKAAEISKDSIAEERESYGSKLTEELISIFRQYEQMNIDIVYTDKQAPETGTIVKLTIKNIRYVA